MTVSRMRSRMSEPGAVMTLPAYPADLEREIALWDGTRLAAAADLARTMRRGSSSTTRG